MAELGSDLEPFETVHLGGTPLGVLGTARLYVCGITPYDTTHLGHAATFVWADVAARVLHLGGRPVDVCRNITDVDDHLLMQAQQEGVPWRSLATQQTYKFEHDLETLGIARPAFEPRSHDHVDGVVTLTAELLEQGRAYERNGSVYFRGADVPGRVGIDHARALELAAERGGHPDDPNKDDPLDAALWVRSIGDEPSWPSPWGPGRPGWHAECTTMALTTFGPSVDLHVGGEDLAFPHHAYEAAQAEAFSGVQPFARAWMHVGTVRHGGEKMAKSTGNLVFVADLLERWPAAAIRLLILSRRFDEPWDFTESALDEAAAAVESLRGTAESRAASVAAHREIVSALRHDFDVPRALAIGRDEGGAVLAFLVDFLGLRYEEKWY